ncbi:corrinoid protein [Bacillota bacterium LX-D]|nr:corrinoid protein [Bacillota bacterium LX-D]
MMAFEEMSQAVISGDEAKVKELVNSAVNAKESPLAIINDGLIAGMNVVGARFKEGDMFVPEVLMAAKAMAAGVDIVKPLLGADDMPSAGTVVLGTVKGDLHDIGKNLVAMMMESGGLNVINVGIDVAPETFIEAVKANNAQIVAMSALLTTTMPAMKDTIEAFQEAGLRDKVKIIVGGAPISQEFADQIGADGYAPDAASATDLVKKLISEM